VSPLRRYRLQLRLTQEAFAAHLNVPDETYRTWKSGRRAVPPPIITHCRRLVETECGQLLPLQLLGSEFGIHVRPLRKAAHDGRLTAKVSSRTAFGKPIAFASRDAVARFKGTYYRKTTWWNRPAPVSTVNVPADYDCVMRSGQGPVAAIAIWTRHPDWRGQQGSRMPVGIATAEAQRRTLATRNGAIDKAGHGSPI
jgi:transcriptional regulator with XRE-family HTH domain